MRQRLARYHKVAALADEPTPLRRLGAAVVAGGLAFLVTQFLLGVLWGAGAGIVFFSSFGFAVAAAVAAVTLQRARAVTYGVIAAIWLLAECVMAALACMVATLG